MKKAALSLIVVAGLVFSVTSCKKATEATEAEDVAETSVEAVTYTVDVENSVVEWTAGYVIGGSTHSGTLNLASGEVGVKDDVLESGSFVFDMPSITVTDLSEEHGKSALEAHLRGTRDAESVDDFFHTTVFPEGKFEITSVTSEGVEGNLTLKGISKNVKVPATVTIDDNQVTLTSEGFYIDRTQWNLNFRNQSMLDVAADKIIKNDVEVKFTVKASVN